MLYLQHVERELHPFIPFLKVTKPTALFFLDKLRYGKSFDSPVYTGKYSVNWHKVKQMLQLEYQAKLEAEGEILKDIWMEREATDESKAVDYLMWLDWMYSLYDKNLKHGEFEDEGFLRFVQSGLVFDEELSETWKIKKNL